MIALHADSSCVVSQDDSLTHALRRSAFRQYELKALQSVRIDRGKAIKEALLKREATISRRKSHGASSDSGQVSCSSVVVADIEWNDDDSILCFTFVEVDRPESFITREYSRHFVHCLTN